MPPPDPQKAEKDEPGRGRAAHAPSEIPRAGWRDILLRVWHKLGEDNVSLVAAGVALNSLLAVFPAMALLASVYGMRSSPSTESCRTKPPASSRLSSRHSPGRATRRSALARS